MKRYIPYLKKVFFVLFGIISVVFLTSLITIKLGDRLLEKDNFLQAKIFYKIGKLTNPFYKEVDKRLLAVQIVESERMVKSEETEDTKPFAEGNENRKVLGASVAVPVLMYHYIRINPNLDDKVGFNLSVTPANFKAQMDYLSSQGYHTITLDELADALYNNTSLPAKPVIITFDDGYKDSYTAAYPILKDHGFVATNFIITGVVGTPLYLTWQQIDEMKNSGVFKFGSHTVNHPALTYLNNDKVREELRESKNLLEAKLLVPIDWFAYPYGNVDEAVAYFTEEAGYLGAFGTNLGKFQSKDKMFTLPRIRIGGGDSVQSFAAKLQ